MHNIQTIHVIDFISLTVGIVVYFVGVLITRQSGFLRRYNIPEPVTGGLVAAAVTFLVFEILNISVSFDLGTRDKLLIYFFTAIGLNARIADLLRGGRALLILFALTVAYIAIQNGVGTAGASLFGLPQPVGILAGSISLIGGHGTAIAWAPDIAERFGIENATEIGVACATFGLILASMVGGPIAKLLIDRNKLKADMSADDLVGLPYDADGGRGTINHMNLMGALLALHAAIIVGYLINIELENLGFKLPLFVTCLMVAIVMSNAITYLFPRMPWPARTHALAVISDYSLNIFLAMSLMSMQLWTLAGLAGPLLGILVLQTVAVMLFVYFILFRCMGGNYEAAVLGAGFGGFALGATPTAVANMTAVAKQHGPAPSAFIILPLVAAFLVDLANAVIIRAFLN
jgi:glutamate:Na+ symporter, ESS family